MFTIERYTGSDPSGLGHCPNRAGSWPTGFAGTGWLVRKDGEIVYADAFRRFCLEYVERNS